MTTDSLTIGVLTFTATLRGPLLDVLVTSSLGGHIEKLPLTIAEWTSLRATVDVLAAADKEMARLRKERDELRAERDVLKQECRETGETLIATTREASRLRESLQTANVRLKRAGYPPIEVVR
jgi:septal ring factor EnvC (AmiA/AmiB activator)